ncbi:MAG TPA: M23 family metallopeptidase [Ignavibacteriaceae bacterium]|nr:M23 family metallopeptidase [Ignavibacteriaceae bacterium]
MKKLFYFSKTKLQFVEIKNYKSKLAGLFSGSVVLLAILAFGIYSIVSSILGINNMSVIEENKLLHKKLEEIIPLYSSLDKELDSLIKENNRLRIAANLESNNPGENLFGVGGGYFDNLNDFGSNKTDQYLSQAYTLLDEVSRKINFEKSQYLEISSKLSSNKKLFSSIPAIKPCDGDLSAHGFGMRMHPILGIMRMHEGIDIITDVGTSVHASGDGVVDFVGKNKGYGLEVEIDHGFGYRTVYAHLSSTKVKVGQKVHRGDQIAKTGNSGLSTGPHLHYEVHHNGVKQDPVDYFFDDLSLF